MNTQVLNTIDEYQKKINGYIGFLFYRYADLCIEADPNALLNMSVASENNVEPIENMAYVTIEDDITFHIYPKDPDYIFGLTQSFIAFHPEFKLEIINNETNEVADMQHDFDKQLYLRITMPPVDKNRYDFLKKVINTLFDGVEASMEVARAEFTGRIIAFAADETPEDIDALKDQLEDIFSYYKDKADQLHEKKLATLEAAYDSNTEINDVINNKSDETPGDNKPSPANEKIYEYDVTQYLIL